ncbi:hypothetical protein ACOSQ3_020572 [Xanthoceras sorbifolium]
MEIKMAKVKRMENTLNLKHIFFLLPHHPLFPLLPRARSTFLLSPALPHLSSWVGDDCCNWVGVNCSNKTGRVSRLDLSARNFFDGIDEEDVKNHNEAWQLLGSDDYCSNSLASWCSSPISPFCSRRRRHTFPLAATVHLTPPHVSRSPSLTIASSSIVRDCHSVADFNLGS